MKNRKTLEEIIVMHGKSINNLIEKSVVNVQKLQERIDKSTLSDEQLRLSEIIQLHEDNKKKLELVDVRLESTLIFDSSRNLISEPEKLTKK
jgi:hypothetical protein